MKINTFAPDEHPFLQVIKSIALKPKTVYCIGSLPTAPATGSDVRPLTVAIVGTRKPTPYGRETTFKLAYDLAKKGVVIVSGLALGVDAAAHKGALEAGGITVAVLANGLDTIYPASHRQLAENIVAHDGALVSEYPSGTPAYPSQFLARNRIVSGLADAVIVTEAAARSGTLATVMHALEQGREVFAVPGNITSPMSVGPNRLLKQGAHPALSADDILEVIAPELLEPQTQLNMGSNPQEQLIIDLLRSGIRDGETLQRESHMPASDFSQTLTMLQVGGFIRSLGGNQWTIA